MLTGIIPNPYIIQGIRTIKAITIGNNIVQEKDINWSKRILGNEALTHMNTKIIIQDFIPSIKPEERPSRIGEFCSVVHSL